MMDHTRGPNQVYVLGLNGDSRGEAQHNRRPLGAELKKAVNGRSRAQEVAASI